MIGKNIQHLRKTNNLLQKQLAIELDVSQQTISKWERNLAEPDGEMLKKLANRFGVSVDYILGNKEEQKKDQALYDEFVKLGLVKDGEEINDTQKEALVKFLQAINDFKSSFKN